MSSELLTVAGEVSVTTLDIGGANVTSTAAELNLVDGITAGTVEASKAVIVDANKDITGFQNISGTGTIRAGDIDIESGGRLTIEDTNAYFYFFETDGKIKMRPYAHNKGVIGGSSSYLFSVYASNINASTIYYSSLNQSSDKRFKENIKPVENILDKVMNINTYEYDIKKDAPMYDSDHPEENKNIIGLIAQEVQEEFPSMVTYNEDDGHLMIKQSSLPALLLEVIKEIKVEHDQEIAELTQEMNTSIEQLISEIESLKQEVQRLADANSIKTKQQQYHVSESHIGVGVQELEVNYPELVVKDTDGSLRIDVPKVLAILNEQNESHQKEATKSLID